MAESSFERFRRQMDSMQFETLPLFSKPYFSWNLTTDYVGRRFVYRPETESTMDDARRMLERFRLTSGAIVMAEMQTAGRGRAGRAWVSAPDVNLQFTLVLLPDQPADQRHLFYVTPLAIALAAEEMGASRGAELHAGLKWPNDVQIDGKKVAGVLIELTENAEGRPVSLVGVGINVNLDIRAYPEIVDIATSLRHVVGAEVPREPLLASFCNHFERLYEQALSGSLAPFQAWRDRLVTLGREVTATEGTTRITGVAVDVDPDGALIIEQAGGRRVRVDAGDVTLRT